MTSCSATTCAPLGCYVYSDGKVYFNTGKRGICTAVRRCIVFSTLQSGKSCRLFALNTPQLSTKASGPGMRKYCFDSHVSFLNTVAECNAAAAELKLADTSAEVWPDCSNPYGCYYKQTSRQLFFNPTGTRNDDDRDRVSICGKVELGAVGERSTDRYKIHVSNNNYDWVPIVDGKLPINAELSQSLEFVPVDYERRVRYVKFSITSSTGKGGGLSYFQAYGKPEGVAGTFKVGTVEVDYPYSGNRQMFFDVHVGTRLCRGSVIPSPTGTSVVDCHEPLTGRDVTVSLVGTGKLQLAEVRVFGRKQAAGKDFEFNIDQWAKAFDNRLYFLASHTSNTCPVGTKPVENEQECVAAAKLVLPSDVVAGRSLQSRNASALLNKTVGRRKGGETNETNKYEAIAVPGSWVGECTCPDGKAYQVSDAVDSGGGACSKLQCINGKITKGCSRTNTCKDGDVRAVNEGGTLVVPSSPQGTSCKCNGKTNSNGDGGPACSSFHDGKKYCYTDVGACGDGKASSQMKSDEYSFSACASGAFTPEVYLRGQWYPICGPNFWNNQEGAMSICKSLGFETGEVIQEKKFYYKVRTHVCTHAGAHQHKFFRVCPS